MQEVTKGITFKASYSGNGDRVLMQQVISYSSQIDMLMT